MTKEQKMNKNYMWYTENYKKLYKLYPNKFLIIVDESVKGSFDTLDSAYESGLKKFGLGNFLLQKCENFIEVLNIYGVY